MAESKKSLNVWLVEDHKTYGERLMRALNRVDGIRCPHRFTACEDALAALSSPDRPDILLLDVELPGMSGIDGLALLRRQAPRTALVILTVFEDDDKIFRAICAGATGYMLKTASVEDITAAIRTAAAGGSPINPTIARRVLEMFSKANPPQRDYRLTPREQEILQLLVQGHTINSRCAAAAARWPKRCGKAWWKSPKIERRDSPSADELFYEPRKGWHDRC
jgi:DNA-binding NarL/FixJ family response regulator